MKPEISVIVPVYNVEKYIGRCIESLLQQTFNDWEMILVDDCSPDNSYGVICKYTEKDGRIICLRQKENHGPMIARRLGDMAAQGNYITYCDGDDMLPPDALKSLYDAAIKTGADVVSGNRMFVRTDGGEKAYKTHLRYGNDSEALLKSLLRQEMKHVLWSKLFKAELIKGHDYETIDHMTNGEDGYILYQVLQNMKNVVQIPNVVYYYMQTPGSSSRRRYSTNALENIIKMQVLRLSLLSKYPRLEKDIIICVSNVIIDLYYKGYDKNKTLSSIINKYNIGYTSSTKIIFKYHNIFKAILLWWKKHHIIND